MSANEKPKLSVLIITLNEERYIKSLLEDIDFADEIIVIDSYSTDQTVAIINSFENVKLIQNKFINYTLQRNFGLDQAKNPWILFIDADEKLTPNLKSEILKTINDNYAASAYLIYRTFMFKNRKLHFSGWQTDKIFRLFKKSDCRYTEDRMVHEKLIVNGEIATLKHKIIHFSYTSFLDYKMKMYNYGVLKAHEKLKKGQKPSYLKLVFHPTYTFLYQYLIRLGILDGIKGITICYLNAYSIFIRYKELFRITSSRI
ncbi:glycosyltransferase family 2 protein [Flavobacterium sp. ANB]|uniref:glycosyltransferase family 2 protein n=1 Tax=unclassified Flavobacterium TaxID=196869 RepID=UPI0012B7C402|nr:MULTISPECIES: glycosyltransferase family 2 protein [unclassified Flavobacterium]MBF4516562.1 glycosyltransferase family 2 protein [Flavobacterium sp. ANB]MTD69541.1 glycosyltransferase [Flavobacterium sp. LC2016-13]